MIDVVSTCAVWLVSPRARAPRPPHGPPGLVGRAFVHGARCGAVGEPLAPAAAWLPRASCRARLMREHAIEHQHAQTRVFHVM